MILDFSNYICSLIYLFIPKIEHKAIISQYLKSTKMQNRIPAGVIDDRTEFFTAVIDGNVHACCHHSMATYFFDNMPAGVLEILTMALKAKPELEADIELMVGTDETLKLKQLIHCRYGLLDGNADIDENGNLCEPEYVPCSLRGTCKFEGKVCSRLVINGAALSPAEEIVFTQIDQANKIIADNISRSKFTVETHRQNISEKTGLLTKIDMVKYAAQNCII